MRPITRVNESLDEYKRISSVDKSSVYVIYPMFPRKRRVIGRISVPSDSRRKCLVNGGIIEKVELSEEA